MGKGMRVIVVGAGGHGKVVADVAITAGYEVQGFVDDAATKPPLPGVPVLGRFAYLGKIGASQDFALVLGIGDNRVRQRIAGQLIVAGFKFVSVIAPSAVVSPYASIGVGTVVMPQVIVNAGAHVGVHAILNSGCVVEHDCTVGDYAHLSPGVCLSGNVRVGDGTHLGTSASVSPGQTIGEWSIIGAGAMVIRNIGSNKVAVGVPAVEKSK